MAIHEEVLTTADGSAGATRERSCRVADIVHALPHLNPSSRPPPRRQPVLRHAPEDTTPTNADYFRRTGRGEFMILAPYRTERKPALGRISDWPAKSTGLLPAAGPRARGDPRRLARRSGRFLCRRKPGTGPGSQGDRSSCSTMSQASGTASMLEGHIQACSDPAPRSRPALRRPPGGMPGQVSLRQADPPDSFATFVCGRSRFGAHVKLCNASHLPPVPHLASPRPSGSSRPGCPSALYHHALVSAPAGSDPISGTVAGCLLRTGFPKSGATRGRMPGSDGSPRWPGAASALR